MEATLILLRWLHFLFGITWIGLLYYFNLVQTPFFAETDPAVRSGAIQKLVPRALWWFRWAAMGTVVVGWIYLLIKWGQMGGSFVYSSYGVAILTGGTIGTIMFLNVWLVIWPKQKVIIASAVAVAGGGKADPAAAPAGRRAGLASRTNTLFSIPLLFFMGSASHYALFGDATRAGLWAWVLICGAIIIAVEANCLFGTQGAAKRPLDSVGGVIHSGIILTIVLVAVIMGVL